MCRSRATVWQRVRRADGAHAMGYVMLHATPCGRCGALIPRGAATTRRYVERYRTNVHVCWACLPFSPRAPAAPDDAPTPWCGCTVPIPTHIAPRLHARDWLDGYARAVSAELGLPVAHGREG